ncbi:MAG TPA: hypothetical protein VFI47_25370 [Acidimicrobiales bacterium]|nr:hypothetical protein [Acidimicrobiales bacterium]
MIAVAYDEEPIEFLPTEEDEEEDDAPGPEELAVHVGDAEPRQRMVVEEDGFDADDLDAESLDEAEAEQADGDGDGDGADAEPGPRGEREDDVEDILLGHYGMEEKPRPEREDEELRPLAPGEFVCPDCRMRKATSQRSGPPGTTCVDCARDDG